MEGVNFSYQFYRSLYHSVTVLLCIGFVLVCTVYIRAISACVPLIVLCFNGYFLRRKFFKLLSTAMYTQC